MHSERQIFCCCCSHSSFRLICRLLVRSFVRVKVISGVSLNYRAKLDNRAYPLLSVWNGYAERDDRPWKGLQISALAKRRFYSFRWFRRFKDNFFSQFSLFMSRKFRFELSSYLLIRSRTFELQIIVIKSCKPRQRAKKRVALETEYCRNISCAQCS